MGLYLRAVVRLTDDARTMLTNFADHVEGQLGPDSEFKPISGLANKLPEHATRLAGALTMFADADAKQIDVEAVENAIKLARHYADEALRLFAVAKIDAKLRQAARWLEWLQQSSKEAAQRFASRHLSEGAQFHWQQEDGAGACGRTGGAWLAA
jgi:hypothetical protein